MTSRSGYGRGQVPSRGRGTSRLLIDEPPLQVLPSLAVAVGLNEAIVLQQVHYWLGRSEHLHDGRRWTYQALDDWRAQFPFWSLMTIRRTLTSLKDQGLLLTANYNPKRSDRTLWYSIDYDALAASEQVMCSKRTDGDVQNEQMEVFNLNTSVPETTSETTQRGDGPSPRLMQLWAATLDGVRLPQALAGDVDLVQPLSWSDGRLVLRAPLAAVQRRWEKRADELVRLLAPTAPAPLRELAVQSTVTG